MYVDHTEEPFKIVPYAPLSWKELSYVIFNIKGAIMSLKEPEIYFLV